MWAVSEDEWEDPLVDAVLLACGKCLHIANSFESKCKALLRISGLINGVYVATNGITTSPDRSIEDIFNGLPGDKMLGATLQSLTAHHGRYFDPTFSADVDRARDARNFIAHEGAYFGKHLTALSDEELKAHVARLRRTAHDLAVGEHRVADILEQMDGVVKRRSPEQVADYPQAVDRWVFGPLDSLGLGVKSVGST